MIMNETKSIAISLDWRKNRIRIFKETLYEMGKPEYICLLVNPDTRTIAVKGTSISDGITHSVNWDALQKERSYELYSHAFLSRLFNINNSWDEEHSYRIYGKVNPALQIAEFKIDDAVKISEEGDLNIAD